MDNTMLKGAVEAVLFAVGEPMPAAKIAEAVEADKSAVNAALKQIADELDDRQSGLCLLRFDDRYQLSTRSTFGEPVTRALDNRRQTPLSQAAMEVLSIIAYNQPVSRSFIDQVRGVDSSSPVSSLLTKGLIAEAGRLELPGRPISFKTTDAFLRSFSLSSLAELPPIHTEEIEYEYIEEPPADSLI